MKVGDYTIIAPFVLGGEYNEAEILGASVWLWIHSASHQHAPLHTLPVILLPAIKSQQFALISKQQQPVAYLSFAWLNETAEHRYLNQASVMMQPEDWTSGDRLWIMDCIAPFGDMKAVRKLLLDAICPDFFGRYLYHRGEARGQQIRTWLGRQVDRQVARCWFNQHPPAKSFV